jgi:hypothetical protein
VIFLLGGALVVLALWALGRGYVKADPKRLAKSLPRIGGVVLVGVAVVLAATGKWAAAMPIGLFGLSLFGFGGNTGWGGLGRLGGLGGLGRPGGTAGRSTGAAPKTSRAASALVELELDHANGTVRGTVRSGRYAGQSLNALSVEALIGLWAGAVGDRESRALLEVYLDRREPRWREHLNDGAAGGQGAAPRTRGMSEQEAYEILGLAQGASADEVRTAHRNLMKRVHPDMGGSAALAARINEAKERLLGGHRRSP